MLVCVRSPNKVNLWHRESVCNASVREVFFSSSSFDSCLGSSWGKGGEIRERLRACGNYASCGVNFWKEFCGILTLLLAEIP